VPDLDVRGDVAPVLAEAVADARRDFDPSWGDDLEPYIIARVMLDGVDLVLTLTSEARLALLRGLYDSPVDQLWASLDLPTKALIARGDSPRISSWKEKGGKWLTEIAPQVEVRWFDTPHLPHSWECGYLMEESTRTLLCGDLFTQGGAHNPAVTESDILEPSEAFRRQMDYFSHTKNAGEMIERLASAAPTTLACMHGSAWRGDGAALLRALSDSLSR